LFHFPSNLFALHQSSKNSVLAVQMTAFGKSDEELGVVSVRASVRHRQKVWFGMRDQEILVRERRTVDGFAARAVAMGYVASLSHETWK
jgi:hypothetical protein